MRKIFMDAYEIVLSTMVLVLSCIGFVIGYLFNALHVGFESGYNSADEETDKYLDYVDMTQEDKDD